MAHLFKYRWKVYILHFYEAYVVVDWNLSRKVT